MIPFILLMIATIWGLIVANAPFLTGLFITPLIDFLNKDIPKERDGIRFAVTISLCVFIAFLFHIKDIVLMQANTGEMIKLLTVIFTETQIVYWRWFKNSFFRVKLLEMFSKPVTPTVTTIEQ